MAISRSRTGGGVCGGVLDQVVDRGDARTALVLSAKAAGATQRLAQILLLAARRAPVACLAVETFYNHCGMLAVHFHSAARSVYSGPTRRVGA